MSVFCNSCGKPINEGSKFCMNCGAPAPAPQAAPNNQQNAAPNYQQTVNVNYGAPQPPVSGFDGGVLETFVAALVASLIMTFTCGIATPWALCYLMKYIISHVTIDGKRLVFVGNGTELFGQWIIWMLLTAITCGIYSFWVMPKMYNWVAKNIHFAN